MTSNRLEAFSDGVLAIVITIMVLEMKVPHGTDAAALRPLLPVFLSYVLSFVYVGIYWNNHHHLFQAVHHVTGAALWANLHLLFWLSLVPFVTGWMGENHLARLPVALYGVVLLGAAVAYRVLTWTLLAHHDRASALARALGRDRKGKASVGLYLLAIGLAALSAWPAVALYAGVALLWLIPDPRVERTLAHADPAGGGTGAETGAGDGGAGRTG
jgi:uncharacterized membrane protein